VQQDGGAAGGGVLLGDVRDAAVSEPDEVLDGQLGAQLVVVEHAVVQRRGLHFVRIASLTP
jgi:hypothetical protein